MGKGRAPRERRPRQNSTHLKKKQYAKTSRATTCMYGLCSLLHFLSYIPSTRLSFLKIYNKDKQGRIIFVCSIDPSVCRRKSVSRLSFHEAHPHPPHHHVVVVGRRVRCGVMG